jgi:enamine deaminase RidA (YjgF/YER057c/UK114 family)
LADINDFVAMNNVYKTFFTQREPARAAYQVRILYLRMMQFFS